MLDLDQSPARCSWHCPAVSLSNRKMKGIRVTVPVARKWPGLAPRKRAALRIALFALAAALLLPACGVYASQAHGAPALAPAAQGSATQHAQHHGGAVTESYCASIGTVAAAEDPSTTTRGVLPAAAPLVPPYPPATAYPAPPVIAASPPLLQISFYLRSARILR